MLGVASRGAGLFNIPPVPPPAFGEEDERVWNRTMQVAREINVTCEVHECLVFEMVCASRHVALRPVRATKRRKASDIVARRHFLFNGRLQDQAGKGSLCEARGPEWRHAHAAPRPW